MTRFTVVILWAILLWSGALAQAQAKRPDILIIWGDDIGSSKEFPPRSLPPGFNPSNMPEDELRLNMAS